MSKRLLPLASLLLGVAFNASCAVAQSYESLPATSVPSRVTERVEASQYTTLHGNTHPNARAQFDLGQVDPGKRLERMQLVLKRSPEQQAALNALNERQFDPKSPDYHRWLHPEEFGEAFGPSDADVQQITSWLENQGFQVNTVGKGKVFIDFSGTVAQVQSAFHVQMHRYLVDGKEHIANDRDPEIPSALSPVINGIASLNDFRARHFSHPGAYVKRDLKTGKYTEMPTPFTSASLNTLQTNQLKPSSTRSSSIVQPEFGYTDPETGYQREMLSPYDVATIYNILPLWNQSKPINGTGVKVAIIGLSDVATSDFNTFRSSFGLPAGTLTTVHSGSDPGLTDSQGENTEDVEMVSSTAPGAQVILVADVDSGTTNGLETAVNYVVDNEVAPILTMSYGACELDLGSSGNSLYNQIFQQAATQGISSFVAAGDSGSTVCTSQNGNPPYADTYGLAVSGMASTPYVTAVGGTDVQWYLTQATHPISTYWNSTNDAHGASAKGYMPEMSWNNTCSNPLLLNVYTDYSTSESLCNAAIDGSPGLVEMGSGSGGVSACTTPSSSTPNSCSGGYAKPSWQTGVTGIPSDGKRDIPDVSMFAAYGYQQSTGIPGSALLICQASNSPDTSCDYSNTDYIIYQENGGTSAASPLTAGIMALVVQKASGAKQGLANPVFYSLAAKQSYSACNSNTVAAGNSCVFNDITSGANASVCITGDTNCITNTAGDEVGIVSGYSAGTGYDLTTGLGTFNVTNLVNAWPVSGSTAPVLSVSSTSLSFASTAVGSTSAAQTVTFKNTGNATLSFTSSAFTGADPSSFTRSSTTCGSTLAAGASCTMAFVFRPQAAGSLTAAASFGNNSATNPINIALAGTGTGTPAPVLAVSPASLSFASTAVGSISAAQTVTFKNTGNATLSFTTSAFTGADPSSFTRTSTSCGSTLAAGASCTMAFVFRPQAAGALTAAASFGNNSATNPVNIALAGTGTSTTKPVLAVSPTSLSFPSTVVGSISASQTVTFKNTGNASLSFTTSAFTGADPSSFTRTSTSCGSTLAAGASCTMAFVFRPQTTGSLTGAASFGNNSATNPINIPLSGTGTSASGKPVLAVSPTSLAFPTTTVGSISAGQTVTFKNTGTATLSFTTSAFTGANPSSFTRSSTSCGSTLASGASCTMVFVFRPQTTGSLSGAASFGNNSATSPINIPLSGTGK